MSEVFKLYQYKKGNKVICSVRYNYVYADYEIIIKDGYWSVARVEDAITVAEKYCQKEGYPDFKVVYKGLYEDPSGLMKFKPSKKSKPTHKTLKQINKEWQDFLDELKRDIPAAYLKQYGEYEGKWSADSNVYHPYVIDYLNKRIPNSYFGLDIRPIPYDYDGWVDRTHVIDEHYGF